MNYLSDQEFKDVYGKVPRLCVDLIIKNDNGILLALRSKEPFSNMWNLPGGTVYKGETIEVASERISKRESGLDIKIKKCLGYIEHLKEPHSDIIVHSVSIALEVIVIGGELHHDEFTKELRYFKELPENLIGNQKEFLKNHK